MSRKTPQETSSARRWSQKLELSKVVKACATARVHAETKSGVDVVANALGAPTSMLDAAWSGLIGAFTEKYVKHI